MDANGLTEVDSTGVLTGNADIACERETPNPDPVKHLPGHEHQAGADWDLYDIAFYALAVVGIFLGVMA